MSVHRYGVRFPTPSIAVTAAFVLLAILSAAARVSAAPLSESDCTKDERPVYGIKARDFCKARRSTANDYYASFNSTVGTFYGCTSKFRRCLTGIKTTLQLSTNQVVVFPDACFPDTDFVQVNEVPCGLPNCQKTEKLIYGLTRSIWCGMEPKETGRKLFCHLKSDTCNEQVTNAVNQLDGTPWVFPTNCVPAGYVEDRKAKLCLVNKCVAKGMRVPKAYSVDFFCIGISNPKLYTQFDDCAPVSRCFNRPTFAINTKITNQLFVFPDTECVPDSFEIMSNLTCKDFPQFKPPSVSTGTGDTVIDIPVDGGTDSDNNIKSSGLGVGSTLLTITLCGGLFACGYYIVKKRRARLGGRSYSPLDATSQVASGGYDSDRNLA